MAEGLWQALLGLAIGLIAGSYLMRLGGLSEELLFNVQPWDPITLDDGRGDPDPRDAGGVPDSGAARDAGRSDDALRQTLRSARSFEAPGS